MAINSQNNYDIFKQFKNTVKSQKKNGPTFAFKNPKCTKASLFNFKYRVIGAFQNLLQTFIFKIFFFRILEPRKKSVPQVECSEKILSHWRELVEPSNHWLLNRSYRDSHEETRHWLTEFLLFPLETDTSRICWFDMSDSYLLL